MKPKRKRYKLRAFNYHVLSILAFLIPLAIWLIINGDTYFTRNTSVKLSVGVSITTVFALLLMKGAFASIEPNTKIVINLFIVLAITYFLDSILDDLFWITFVAIIGYVIYIPLNRMAKINEHRATVLDDELIKEEVKKSRVGNV